MAVVAVALLVLLLITRRRLSAQRRLTAAAEERSVQQAAELALTADARDAADRARAEAEERTATTSARIEELEAESAAARAAAATAAAERDQARHDADTATAARAEAEERLAGFEARAAEAAAAQAGALAAVEQATAIAPAAAGELDAQVLWALEKSRSERTWRHSVAVGPDGSPFAETHDPLHEALQIELDAAREEVGAVVELDADLPPAVSAAGAVLTLRAAQELLAEVVRRSESTVLHVHADGADLVVDVESRDEDGNRVEPGPLPTPPS